MFAVPEVDDDVDVSAPVKTKQPIASPEATKESLPPPPPPPPPPAAPSIEKVDKNLNKIQVPPPPPPPPTSKQHRSRRSLFHRNTIHICDQIVDRV